MYRVQNKVDKLVSPKNVDITILWRTTKVKNEVGSKLESWFKTDNNSKWRVNKMKNVKMYTAKTKKALQNIIENSAEKDGILMVLAYHYKKNQYVGLTADTKTPAVNELPPFEWLLRKIGKPNEVKILALTLFDNGHGFILPIE